MKISNKTYDILKWIALVFLPAFTTFYGVVGTTLQLNYVQETLTIMIAFDTFLGALLGVSSNAYRKDDDIPADIKAELIFEEDNDDGK